MKALLLIAAVFLFTSAIQTQHAIVARKNSGAAGPSYLLTQNFDGAGTPSGWTTGGTGTIDPDYTVTILEGTESLYMDDGGTSSTPTMTSPAWTDIGEAEGFFMLRPVTLPGASRRIMRFMLNGATGAGDINIDASGRLVIAVGATSITTTTGMSAGTTYNVWWRYKKDPGGSTGIGTVAFSASTTKPTADGSGNGFATRTTMTGTSDIDAIQFAPQFSTTGPEIIVDKVRVDDAVIGNNPA